MSAQSHWGWRPRQTEGIWRHGCAWTKPLFAAVPWITLTLLLALFCFIGDRLPQVPGLVCDLPDPVAGQAEATGLAALVLPAVGAGGETLVFFDDGRYTMGDDTSAAAFSSHLEDRVSRLDRKTLLVLADRRVATGEIMKIAALARRSGVESVLFAEKRAGKADE